MELRKELGDVEQLEEAGTSEHSPPLGREGFFLFFVLSGYNTGRPASPVTPVRGEAPIAPCGSLPHLPQLFHVFFRFCNSSVSS